MHTRHENRSGQNRRHSDLSSVLPLGVDRRWKTDQRSYVVDEGEVYDAESRESDDYWQRLFSIPSEDCK
jgi:hypothetical protein